VLIPVLDADKHYWVGDDEVEKLIRSGEGWLTGHPERELIVNRYLKYQRSLTSEALARLFEDEDVDPDRVEPFDFVARGRRGLVQPALKCRGREYLRIIYGPEYTESKHLERLRARSLGRKRSLAEREFALGIEALERFVRGEPLHRVHECVFGVLALEAEPLDPRL